MLFIRLPASTCNSLIDRCMRQYDDTDTGDERSSTCNGLIGRCKLILADVGDERRELAECRFEAYPIDTWGQATLGPGTPLFSSQWQASQSQAGAGSQVVQISQVCLALKKAAVHLVMQTLKDPLC